MLGDHPPPVEQAKPGEQGVAMLSSVLKSKRAVQVNIAIMRAFVKLRQILSSHAELARKLEETVPGTAIRLRAISSRVNFCFATSMGP